MSDFLMLHIEELQNDNYRNKNMETLLKQKTTREGGGQRKYKDADKGENNNAIIDFATNQEDLYGMIRADEALLSRLVILHFRDITGNKQTFWETAKKELFGGNSETDIGFTLYKDLKENYEIYKGFSTCRYYGDDKLTLLSELRDKNKNSIDSWFQELSMRSETYEEDTMGILVEKKNRQKEEFIAIQRSSIGKSYADYMRKNPRGTAFKVDNVLKFLEEKGFTLVKAQGTYFYQIKKEEFEKLRKGEEIEEADWEEG
jgi:hypothetical protein